MKVNDLKTDANFELINRGNHMEDEITTPFCCDLLSVAMNHAPEGCAWITVMANVNTLAVASLADTACIILACDVSFDANALEKAAAEGITIFKTSLPIFDAALEVYHKIHG